MSSVSASSALGALPARFRRQRVLIVGCGDVGLRVARLLQGQCPPSACARAGAHLQHRARGAAARGISPCAGNLDQGASLRRLAGLATRVVHLAPPPGQGEGGGDWWRDPRTLALVRSLRQRSLPMRWSMPRPAACMATAQAPG